jgi:WD40 repeat protein
MGAAVLHSWGFQLEKPKLVMKLTGHHSAVYGVAFSADGKYVASAEADGRVRVWEVARGNEWKSFRAHEGMARCVAFSPDGYYLASGGVDKIIRIWSLVSEQQPAKTFRGGHTAAVLTVGFTPDGSQVVSGGEDGTIKVWSFETSNVLRQKVGHTDWVTSISISAKRKLVASGSNDRTVKIWSLESGKELSTVVGHTDWIRSVSFGREGTMVVSGSDDQTVRYTTVDDPKKSVLVRAHKGAVLAVSHAASGSMWASGGSERRTFIWSAERSFERPVATLENGGEVQSLHFSSDERLLAVGTDRGEIEIWEVSAGKPRVATQSATSAGSKETTAPNTSMSVATPQPAVPTVSAPHPAVGIDITVDVESNIPETKEKNPDAVAVVIGISEYLVQTVPKAEFSKRDAALIRQYLVKSLGYDPNNILPRDPDQPMTAAAMKNLIRNELRMLIKGGKSDVFVYYSGYGAPNPSSGWPSLVPADCDPNQVYDDNAYSLKQFYEDVSWLNARSITVAIDASFWGFNGYGGLIIRAQVPYAAKDYTLPVRPRVTVLLSSEMGQVANWYPEKQYSMFTYFFARGLQGAADLNGDKTITVEEMEQFLLNENSGLPYWSRKESNRPQTPRVIAQNKSAVLVKY